MRRHWIEFGKGYEFLPLGFGVTTENFDATIGVLQAGFSASGTTMPAIANANAIEDVDVSELQERLHLPLGHFGIPCNRGLRYPQIAIRS